MRFRFKKELTTEEVSGWEAHKTYGQRATCETWNEEAKNQMALAHIKMDDFWGSSALFQCAIIAYNTIRWMALCSGDRILRRWEPSTVCTFLIRVAGKLTGGGRQQELNTPAYHLYRARWDAWVAVGLA